MGGVFCPRADSKSIYQELKLNVFMPRVLLEITAPLSYTLKTVQLSEIPFSS